VVHGPFTKEYQMNKDFIITAIAIGLALSFAVRALGSEVRDNPNPSEKVKAYFLYKGKEVPAIEAARVLMQNTEADVVTCRRVMLNNELRLVARKPKK
jgi:hypothetical protein